MNFTLYVGIAFMLLIVLVPIINWIMKQPYGEDD